MGRDGELFEVAVLFEKHDLTLFVTEDETAVSHPCVARDICAQVTQILSWANLLVDGFEGAVFLLLEVAIDVLSCDDHYVLVEGVEGEVAGHLGGHDLEAGLGDAALLIPLPQIQLKIWPTRQRRQNLVILRTKLHRNKLRRLTIRQHNNLPLLKHRGIHSRPFLLNRL